MLSFFILTAVVGLGLSMDFSSDDEAFEEHTERLNEIDLPTRAFDMPDVIGDAGANVETGTDGDNTMLGGAGNDTLIGGEGDDTLYGGTGDDQLFGQEDNDNLVGGPGDDALILGAGNDVSDPLLGSEEDSGNDLIRGGDGDDLIADGKGNNLLFGDAGDDVIVTVDGYSADGSIGPSSEINTGDRSEGGSGDDVLIGDAGDTLTGGTGDDNFFVSIASEAAAPFASITDFDTNEDILTLVYFQDGDDDPDVRFAPTADGSGLSALVNGQPVAELQGLGTSDIAGIDYVVANLSD